jgi:hypothetical protein
MEIFEDWDAAVSAKTDELQICGTLLKSGAPRYFLMPAAAPDEDIRDRAFAVREGRDISDYEKLLLEQAMRLRDPVPT